ncbi:MAG TPA: type I DNA topoisomerase [Clostridiales bacterium]|jgi:DNA topoisomerase-1|nr:type I DNA topoisomerase [Clostridiales bacterium]
MAKTNLVIVESPAKARTIEKYLGGDYKVAASIGHLRDLPKSKLGVDIENGFLPDYKPIKGREDTIKQLLREAQNSEKVYLATDPDREGEAISWHLKELLNLSDEKALRVTFNEITKKVVTESINNPRPIDLNLVNAQQARRILDRIVGYKISPLLWRKIKRGLSAGRVQSVATRMVVDREEEIRSFSPEEYWTLTAELMAQGTVFSARFHGKGEQKQELKSEDEVNEVISAVKNDSFVILNVKRADKPKSPAPPFITSTLQQEASRKLGMTPKRTMTIAQQLYEGVDIAGEGAVGLITYMRTDSLRISEEAMGAARDYIKSRFGSEYCPPQPRKFKTKGNAQDAHEAIRPSNVNLTPDSIRKDLTTEQYKLYRLIWSRFLASQMANAIYDSVSIDAVSAGYTFKATYSSIKFDGYTAVYEEGRDDEEEKESPLPELAEGQTVELKDILKEQKFTQPPPRYTEATLIRAMEEKGIGRPSTYAPILSTIISREYVVREGKSLRPTPLGEIVTKLMKDKFTDIVDLKFTARMEDSLDLIEEGKIGWQSVLSEFYEGFKDTIEKAEKSLEGERIKVPDEVSSEICEKCGRNMVIKSGRFGRFLACPGYPECNNTKPIVVEMPGRCPKCGSRILKRSSKRGYAYYACEKGQECGFMTWDVPTKDNCPECGNTMFKKSGRGYKKPFCINESCPKFVPEDKRGGFRKAAAKAENSAGETAEEAKPENKSAKTSKSSSKTAEKSDNT